MFWAVPLVEHFIDKVHMLIQPKPHWPLVGESPGIALDLHLHNNHSRGEAREVRI